MAFMEHFQGIGHLEVPLGWGTATRLSTSSHKRSALTRSVCHWAKRGSRCIDNDAAAHDLAGSRQKGTACHEQTQVGLVHLHRGVD
jgi:hypothetical protein